jgi:hypothetical protein
VANGSHRQRPTRRFLPKRLGSLALPFATQPPIRHSRPHDEFTALGRDTSAAGISQRQMVGVIVESQQRASPRARSSTKNLSSS